MLVKYISLQMDVEVLAFVRLSSRHYGQLGLIETKLNTFGTIHTNVDQVEQIENNQGTFELIKTHLD